MDLAPPPADAAPSSTPPAPPPPPDAPDSIIGGVAGLLAARLDVEALWVRIAFVLLALVGGVGVVLYGALWLLLVVGQDPSRQWARWVGGAVLVFGLPLVLTEGFAFFDGPFAVLALLVGLAVALWQPRRPLRPAAPFPAPVVEPAASVDDDVARASRWRLPQRPHHPPSILGRLTFGTAILVAAGGALIDQANGGRLHPEQWLGAAAIVCGAGLLVGTLRGRARWLIVPATLFAGTGFVAGEAARVGVEPTALFGDEYVYVGTQSGPTQREHVVIGMVEVSIGEAPSSPVTVDARVGIGTLRVSAADDVTVEVRADVRHGEVTDNGAPTTDQVTIGPEGRPDVVVLARVGRGDVEIVHYSVTDDGGPPPAMPVIDQRYITDGVAITARGQFVLGSGEAVIGADDTLLAGSAITRDRITVITTTMGDFQLLPDGLLLTPYGELLDLAALRGDLPVETPEVTAPPVTTTPGG